MKILFIGNSYTYYNQMPETLFAPIVQAAGHEAEVISITEGGRYLDWPGATAERIDAALAENAYDYVVIQEQSTCPAEDPERFWEAARALTEKIYMNGAKPVFYCTWGRRDTSPTLEEKGWTHESMTALLEASYTKIAEETGALIARVGAAFTDVYRNHPEIELYDPDSTHPSAAGSFLAALVIYAAVYDEDPMQAAFSKGFSKEEAAVLKEAASNHDSCLKLQNTKI